MVPTEAAHGAAPATDPGVLSAAIIGTGAVAKEHIACLGTLPRAQVAAVCDLSPAVAESTAERFGVPAWFSDADAMLAQARPDVVHVTTPPGTHLALAHAALEAGAHVIVEKPLDGTADEIDALLDEAERRRLVVIEDYNYLFNPQVLELRELLASGSLGELVHAEVDLALDILGQDSVFADPNAPHPALALPGGAIGDFLPHLASLAHLLAGDSRAVRSHWSKRAGGSVLEADDMRALVVGARATAYLSFSATSQPDAFSLRAHGTRMRFEANLFEPRTTVERVRDMPRPLQPVANGLAEASSVAVAATRGLWSKLRGAPGGYAGLWELLRRTYAAIESGGEPPVTPSRIRAVNALVRELTAGANRI